MHGRGVVIAAAAIVDFSENNNVLKARNFVGENSAGKRLHFVFTLTGRNSSFTTAFTVFEPLPNGIIIIVAKRMWEQKTKYGRLFITYHAPKQRYDNTHGRTV